MHSRRLIPHVADPPRSRGRRWWLPADAFAALALVAWAILAAQSHRATGPSLGLYYAGLSAAWAGALISWWFVRHAAPGPGWQRRVWVWAVLLRLTGFFGQPLFEDDHYRYLWDGHVLATTGNPYASRPMDYFERGDVPPEFQAILDRINHPDIPTIYGPVCQLAFGLGHWVAPGQLWPLKLVLLLADLGVLAALVSTGRSKPVAAWFYAVCPLVLQETAFTAHIDGLGVAAMVGALVAWDRRRWTWVGVGLGLAIGVKVFAILLAPFLLRRANRAAWMSLLATLVAVHLPFIWQGNPAGALGLGAFLQNWEFNSIGFAVGQAILGTAPAKILAGFLLGAWMIWLFVRETPRTAGLLPPSQATGRTLRPWPPGDWIFGGFLVLSPVINPWYLLWMAPFVARQPSAAGITALAAVSLSYLTGMNLGMESLAPYAHPTWVRPVEAAAVACALVWDIRKARVSGPARTGS